MELNASSNIYKTYSWGRYNNILIYDTKENTFRKIFSNRTLIKNIKTHQFHQEQFMILTTKDLSMEDNKIETLIYKFADQSITKLALPEMDTPEFTIDDDSGVE